MRVRLPGRSFSFEVPEENLLGVFESRPATHREAVESVVAKALAYPIGSAPLRELARESRRVLILTDDITRPTPTAGMLPPLLDELARGGIGRDSCTILIAGGTHRPMTHDEVERKLGSDLSASVEVRHHCAASAELVDLEDPAGLVPIQVNRLAAESDFVIGVGQILPHAIAGYAGGGKILAPGICGRETIRAVHWSMHRVSPDGLYWYRDHPVREVVDRVAGRSGLRFIVDIILDGEGRPGVAVAGDPVTAHREGCRLAPEYRGVSVPGRADIVVADAWPFDVDWWQAIKALPAAAEACRPGGVMIVIADCPEGFAPEYREPVSFGYPPADEVIRLVDEGSLDGIVGAHMLIGSAALRGSRSIVLVSRGLTEDEAAGMGFARRDSVGEALDLAFSSVGKRATVSVLPGAAQVIPVVAGSP